MDPTAALYPSRRPPAVGLRCFSDDKPRDVRYQEQSGMIPSTTFKPRAVLLVEDDLELANVLHERLAAEGYRVTVCPDGAEALRALIGQDFDAVVCDMVMPRMAGDMFFYAVHRMKPALCERFIFITGYGETPKVKEFLAGMTDTVLMKPFNLEDLLGILKRLLQRVETHRPGTDLRTRSPQSSPGDSRRTSP
jgi:CheY-like chemotaxis protein